MRDPEVLLRCMRTVPPTQHLRQRLQLDAGSRAVQDSLARSRPLAPSPGMRERIVRPPRTVAWWWGWCLELTAVACILLSLGIGMGLQRLVANDRSAQEVVLCPLAHHPDVLVRVTRTLNPNLLTRPTEHD